MSTTLYVLLTSAILLGAENGDVSQAIDTSVKIFKEYLLGYIVPLIAISILQLLLGRLARLKQSKPITWETIGRGLSGFWHARIVLVFRRFMQLMRRVRSFRVGFCMRRS